MFLIHRVSKLNHTSENNDRIGGLPLETLICKEGGGGGGEEEGFLFFLHYIVL